MAKKKDRKPYYNKHLRAAITEAEEKAQELGHTLEEEWEKWSTKKAYNRCTRCQKSVLADASDYIQAMSIATGGKLKYKIDGVPVTEECKGENDG